MKKIFICFLSMGALSACVNHQYDYLQSHAEPRLAVPPSLSSAQFTTDYSVPNGAVWSPTHQPNLLPPGSLAAQKAGNPIAAKGLTEMGLGAEGEPALLVHWPKVKTFESLTRVLAKLGYQITQHDDSSGLISASRQNQHYIFGVQEDGQNSVILVALEHQGILSSSNAMNILQEIARDL